MGSNSEVPILLQLIMYMFNSIFAPLLFFFILLKKLLKDDEDRYIRHRTFHFWHLNGFQSNQALPGEE